MNDDRNFISSDDRNSNFGDFNKFSCKMERPFPSDDGSSVDALIENCYLDLDLRHYADDSFFLCRNMSGRWSCEEENKYLRELWEWESSAIKPIREWLGSSVEIVDPRTATDEEISISLYILCVRLRKIHQKLDHIDHLSDRRLYELLIKDVLPCPVKYLPHGGSVSWDFCYYLDNERETRRRNYDSVWLTYYATEDERYEWLLSSVGASAPPRIEPPYRRTGFPFE